MTFGISQKMNISEGQQHDGDSNTKNIGQRMVRYQISSSNSKTGVDVPIPGDFPFPCSITKRDQNCKYIILINFVGDVLIRYGGCIGVSQNRWIQNHGFQY